MFLRRDQILRKLIPRTKKLFLVFQRCQINTDKTPLKHNLILLLGSKIERIPNQCREVISLLSRSLRPKNLLKMSASEDIFQEFWLHLMQYFEIFGTVTLKKGFRYLLLYFTTLQQVGEFVKCYSQVKEETLN